MFYDLDPNAADVLPSIEGSLVHMLDTMDIEHLAFHHMWQPLIVRSALHTYKHLVLHEHEQGNRALHGVGMRLEQRAAGSAILQPLPLEESLCELEGNIYYQADFSRRHCLPTRCFDQER